MLVVWYFLVVRRRGIRTAGRRGRVAGPPRRVAQRPGSGRGREASPSGSRRVVTRPARSTSERGRRPTTSSPGRHQHRDIINPTGNLSITTMTKTYRCDVNFYDNAHIAAILLFPEYYHECLTYYMYLQYLRHELNL